MANYYNGQTIGKFQAALKEAKEEVKAGKVKTASISSGNVKMGAVPSVSTLPFLTCPARCKGTCGGDCYAAKIANLRGSVLKSYARNTALLMLKPDLYWKSVNLAMAGNRFFRFHVSGDIRNGKDFSEIVKACKENSHCQVLVFTKRYEIVNAWIKENGSLPENLHLLFSGWENLKPVNPHNLPETNVFGKEGPAETGKFAAAIALIVPVAASAAGKLARATQLHLRSIKPETRAGLPIMTAPQQIKKRSVKV